MTVTPATLSFVALGETARINATVRDQYDNSMATAIVAWASSDGAVATVSEGLVTAAGVGTATITGTSGAASGSAAVTVNQQAATLTVSPLDLNFVALGETAALSAAVFDARGNAIPDASVDWLSNAPAVAAVDASGQVTAVGNGSATITGSSGVASGVSSVTVRQEAASVSVSPESVILWALGDTVKLSAMVLDAGGNAIVEPSLSWISNTPDVASVDASGRVRAIGFGRAVITARVGAVSDAAAIRVSTWRVYESEDPFTNDTWWVASSIRVEARPRMNFPYEDVTSDMYYLCEEGDSDHESTLALFFTSAPNLTNDTPHTGGYSTSTNRVRWGAETTSESFSQEWGAKFLFFFSVGANSRRAASGVSEVAVELHWFGSGRTVFTYPLGEDARDAINAARGLCGQSKIGGDAGQHSFSEFGIGLTVEVSKRRVRK